MNPRKNWIIVRVDMEQKDRVSIGGKEFLAAVKFNNNYREKKPVIAVVEIGNNELSKGELIICHHNFFYERSPYQLENNLFAIKYNKNIFVKLDEQGEAFPICGNLTAKTIPKTSIFSTPPAYQKDYLDRCQVIRGNNYAQGQLVFVIPYSCYEIVYIFNGEERRIIKIHQDDIVASIN